ncbi:hypothetical protein GCM10009849_11740 [Sinomonas flava]|uniref:Uncharacterized protein n=1 Tax=Sinomonas flava TaxID=496857 RepID=A0ABN3BPI4_9MICC
MAESTTAASRRRRAGAPERGSAVTKESPKDESGGAVRCPAGSDAMKELYPGLVFCFGPANEGGSVASRAHGDRREY